MTTSDITIQPNVKQSSVVLAEQQKLSEMSNVFSYEGNDVTMRLENGVVFVNLTEVAKVFPTKNLSTIINSKEIQEYVTKLATKLKNFSSADLLIVRKGGNKEQGTWVHQRVALRVAQKLSTDFAIWVDEKIEELLTEGHTSIYQVPQSFADALMLAAQQQKRIGELEEMTAYTREILNSPSTVLVSQIAQDYGMSAKKLNATLRDMHIQRKIGGQWILYAKFLDKGYVHSDTTDITHKDGTPDVKLTTKWTQKGRLFLYQQLKKNGILPMIEQSNLFQEGGQYAV